MKKLAIVIGLFVAVTVQARERVLWDFDWQFCRGAETSAWSSVELPHDWSIERVAGTASLFATNNAQCSGCLPGGTGWYRKTFTLPASAKGQRVIVEFEGVYMDSDVWLNGQHLGNRPYGYIGFEYDLTPHVKWDAPNELLVRAKVEQPCSRWFSGAGIYRHVWLTTTAPVHLAQWGTVVTTPKIAKESAEVRVRAALLNQTDAPKSVAARISIVDPTGRELASANPKVGVEAGKLATADVTLNVTSPKLWSLKAPVLYTARIELLDGGSVIDRVETPFGIRTIEFTKDRGFFLNGEPVQIYGVCNHHDQGYLGAAAYDRAIERQLEILKTMGCNAIRTSHNPPAPKLLELCDRMGFLVMDEAFDEWKWSKTKMGYGRFFDAWSERDIRDMVRRDRNHPSVILWSIGNEISEQGSPHGGEMAKRLADFVRDEDPTRPVTSACHQVARAMKSGYAAALDVLGINYNISNYTEYKGTNALIASETSSAVSSRGEYNLVLKEGAVAIDPRLNTHCTAYDVYRPGWAVNAELQLKTLADRPWVAGEFVWTGFDYIGEPTPFPWPAVSSYFGIVDLAGFPKDRFYVYQSRWTDAPMVHLLPHWNWPQFVGKEIPVWCYSNADTVELFLNGKSLGEKTMSVGARKKYTIEEREDPKTKKKSRIDIESGWYHQEWLVPYTPGTLKAVAKRGGQVVATEEVATTGVPAKLAVKVDRHEIAADGQDLAYVTVSILDAKGRLCPEADTLIQFKVAGAGKLIAVGNGNPIDHDDFQATQRKAFHGLALGIIKAGKASGTIGVTVSANSLQPASMELKVK